MEERNKEKGRTKDEIMHLAEDIEGERKRSWLLFFLVTTNKKMALR